MKALYLVAGLLFAGALAQAQVLGPAPVAVFSAAAPTSAPTSTPTFTGTVTFPDASTWGTAGLATAGTIPTIASGACGATTNGTVTAGSRTNAGNIAIGAATTTTCTVTFAATLQAAPFCVIAPANAAAAATGTTVARVSANTTAGFVITGSALANANYNYVCM